MDSCPVILPQNELTALPHAIGSDTLPSATPDKRKRACLARHGQAGALPASIQDAPDRGNIRSAIGSTAKGETVARRRYQRGSVFKNKTKTVWLGMYSEYVLNSNGVEKRHRKQVVLGSVRQPNGDMTKREAQRLLQPYVDRVNSSLSALARESKSATFEEFSKVWERDYLCLSKPSTQASMRGQVKRLAAAFGKKDMRQIDAGDLQRVIATMESRGLDAKTIRNLWVTARLVWAAAVAQKYADSLLPKPKLPRLAKRKPRYFLLEHVGRILANSQGELRTFYLLAAESGLRAGELCALHLVDIDLAKITVNRSVWNGQMQDSPKTDSSVRTVAVSAQLGALLWEQSERQRAKGHALLFSTRNGSPWEASRLVKRKLGPLLAALGIPHAGLHAFRHFNASLLSSLRVPLKTIQERLGHASVGSLTLDVYTHSEWKENVEAAQLAGEAIEKSANSVSLTAIQQKGLPVQESETLVYTQENT
jgi:integrase